MRYLQATGPFFVNTPEAPQPYLRRALAALLGSLTICCSLSYLFCSNANAASESLSTPALGSKSYDPPIYRQPAFPYRPLGTPPRGYCWLGHYPDVPYTLHPIWEIEFSCEGTFGNPKLIVMPNGECVCVDDPDFDPLSPYR